jgi:hypothetical protein
LSHSASTRGLLKQRVEPMTALRRRVRRRWPGAGCEDVDLLHAEFGGDGGGVVQVQPSHDEASFRVGVGVGVEPAEGDAAGSYSPVCRAAVSAVRRYGVGAQAQCWVVGVVLLEQRHPGGRNRGEGGGVVGLAGWSAA